jgi:hypothetical protein
LADTSLTSGMHWSDRSWSVPPPIVVLVQASTKWPFSLHL